MPPSKGEPGHSEPTHNNSRSSHEPGDQRTRERNH